MESHSGDEGCTERIVEIIILLLREAESDGEEKDIMPFSSS